MGSKNEKGAIGLLAVMGVGFLALTGVLIMSEGVLSGLAAGQNTTSAVRAFYASESVVEEGISRHLKEVYDKSASSTSSTFSSALILGEDIEWNEITIEPIPGTYRFVVKGETKSNQPIRRVVKMVTTYPAGVAFDHALYSAGSGLTLGGNSKVIGSVYSYGPLKIQNDSGVGYTIDGNAYSSDNIEPFGDNSIDGNVIKNFEPVVAPDIKAINYKEIASSTLTYFTSNTLAQKCIDDGSCDDKVVYIDVASGADIKINSTSTVSIVTPSDLKIKGGTFIAPENYPVIVSDGKLSTGGGTKIYGLVVVGGEGEALLANNTEFFGAVIFTSNNVDLTKLGTIKITYDNSTFKNITEFEGLGMQSNDISSATRLNWNEI